jgi:Uma2 family endonuclease
LQNLPLADLSASDSLVKTQEKIDRWIENGAQLGWLIDPYAKKAYIYAPGVPVTIVAAASIQGGGVVEGFSLDLLAIWRRYEI